MRENPGVEYSLHDYSMNDYWEHQEAINRDNYQCIFNDIKTRIRDQYIQEFFTNINNNARLEKYCILKTEFVYEEYLNIMDQKARNEISKFRCSAHKLLVERGRYQNVERNRRICKNCNMIMVTSLSCLQRFTEDIFQKTLLYMAFFIQNSNVIEVYYIIKKFRYILKKGYAIAP